MARFTSTILPLALLMIVPTASLGSRQNTKPHDVFVQTRRLGSVIFNTRGSSALPHTGQNLYGGVSSWECIVRQAIRPSSHQAIRPSGHRAIRPSDHSIELQ